MAVLEVEKVQLQKDSITEATMQKLKSDLESSQKKLQEEANKNKVLEQEKGELQDTLKSSEEKNKTLEWGLI